MENDKRTNNFYAIRRHGKIIAYVKKNANKIERKIIKIPKQQKTIFSKASFETRAKARGSWVN